MHRGGRVLIVEVLSRRVRCSVRRAIDRSRTSGRQRLALGKKRFRAVMKLKSGAAGRENNFCRIMKAAPVYLLIDGKTSGPHYPEEIVGRMDPGDDDNGNPLPILSEDTLSCIDGMKRWHILKETLIYSYAKMLPALPKAKEWIDKSADCALNVRDLSEEIRKTIQKVTGIEDWAAPQYIEKAISTNAYLLRSWEEYLNRQRQWDKIALEYYPLMEFEPFDKSSLPRWIESWQSYGGSCRQDRMIARKDDPCWKRFSDFGFPFTPFSFGRDGLLYDRSLTEAFELGFAFDAGQIKLPLIESFKIVGL
jgi:hypothetical protein